MLEIVLKPVWRCMPPGAKRLLACYLRIPVQRRLQNKWDLGGQVAWLDIVLHVLHCRAGCDAPSVLTDKRARQAMPKFAPAGASSPFPIALPRKNTCYY